jgi:hypothetical protein
VVEGASDSGLLPVLTPLLSYTSLDSTRSCRMCIQAGCERRGWPSKPLGGKPYECGPCAAKPRCIWQGCDAIAPAENELCVGHEWRRRKDGSILRYAHEMGGEDSPVAKEAAEAEGKKGKAKGGEWTKRKRGAAGITQLIRVSCAASGYMVRLS